MNDRGFSDNALARMHDVLGRHAERGSPPGLVALVSRGDDVRVETLGAMAVEGGAPMRRDAIFRIASLTKPVTAVAAMLLVEECRLRLDDPVDDLLPELANRRVLTRIDAPLDDTVPARRSITLRDLLTFRLGFGSVMAPPDTYPIQRAMRELGIGGDGPPHPAKAAPADEWLRRLGSLPLMEQPGARWRYNTGADVLGLLVERASGRPFDTFLRERLFEPLGMRDTGFHVPAEQRHRLPPCYVPDPATGALALYDGVADSEWGAPPAHASGAGGLVSTVDDFHAFYRMLLAHGRHGRERVLSRPSAELMTTDQLLPAEREGAEVFFRDDASWGFGVAIVTRRTGLPRVGQYGWTGGLGTLGFVDPAEGLIGLLFTQTLMTSPVMPPVFQDFTTTAYAAIEDP